MTAGQAVFVSVWLLPMEHGDTGLSRENGAAIAKITGQTG